MTSFRKHTFLFALTALLLSTLACRAATDIFSPEDESATSVPVPTEVISIPTTVVEGQTCPVLLSDIIDAAAQEGSDTEAQDEQYIVTYTVDGDQISDPQYESVSSDLQDEQEDTASQEFVWSYFTSLIPEEQRGFITEYDVTTDGVDNTLAAVTQTQNDPNNWALEVDILDIKDTRNLTFTLIHEFGHLLTLNPDQVPPSIEVFNNPDDESVLESEVAACPQYFPGEGCSTSSSYINAFYNRFWPDIHDEWSAISDETDEEARYELLDNFYSSYQDQFVTSYAVTTPEEDIAESWTYFVLTSKPQGDTIADQKVLFFYEYPELVELRGTILSNICESFPK
ncbi:MAG: hypothetical protein IPP66_22445 [Anaerolineales bacterium]|nr:hypothetical protein [Anaerolineales bacterium]